jgi:phosphatidate cytidylyltransferase
LITALVLAAGLLLALFALPPMAASLVFSVLILIGAWEWSALAGFPETAGRVIYAGAALLIGVALWFFVRPETGLTAIAAIDVAVWVVGLFWILRSPESVPRSFALLSGLIVLPFAWWLITELLAGRGPWWVLLLIVVVAAADIGAFFSGRAFGRVKLAPRVSPGKSWEGVVGGVLGAAIVGAIAGAWLELSITRMVLLTVSIAAISVVGDLTLSMLKRRAGVKDSGTIFPGHGGVLDRVDSLLAALPLYLLGLGVIAGS